MRHHGAQDTDSIDDRNGGRAPRGVRGVDLAHLLLAAAGCPWRSRAPTIDVASPTAQIVSAWALLTWPGLVYAAVAGLALWAYRHQLRQLAVALILIIPLAWGISGLLKISLQRERPEGGLDLLTSTGYAYPSGHTAFDASAIGRRRDLRRDPAARAETAAVGIGRRRPSSSRSVA